MDGRLVSLLALVSVALSLTAAQSPLNHTRPVFQCGGHLVTDSGFVASEGFPNHYQPNSKCTWYITVPAGHVVMLSFRLLDMEADATCRYDYLDVYSGHTRLGQQLGRFCGTFRPGAVMATSNTMMLHMEADASTSGRGFVAYFSAGKPHVEENQFCGGRLTKEQGSVRTPNWPNSDYPAGISCSWHISVETSNVIEVKFAKLDLEPDTYCRYDYVAFFNGGERDDSRRIGKFCGDTAPGTIVTNGNELLVQFVSDLSVTSDGFMAFYSSVPRGSRAPTPGGDFIYNHSAVTRTQRPGPTPKPRPGPVLRKPATRPAARRPLAKPSAKPKVAKPSAKPKVAKPSAKPKVGKPSAKPKVAQPSAKPKVAQPSAKPKVAQPSAKPKVAQPSAKPKVAQPSAKHKVAQPSAKPRVAQPSAKPKVAKPSAKPKVAKPKVAKPKVAKPTAKPKVAKPKASKPSTKPWPKSKPKATAKPKLNKFKPTPKPSMKSTGKPPKAKAQVKPTPKPLATPVRTYKPVVKPSIPPKVKPEVPAKPVHGKTTTRSPALIRKLVASVSPQCNQACKRTGTLQSNFCPHDFVVAGRVSSLTPGRRGSVVAEVSVIQAYKTGGLKLLKAGGAVSLRLRSACRRCPGLQKGLNYVLMGKVDSQGSGQLTPSSFTLLYKPAHAKALANYARQSC